MYSIFMNRSKIKNASPSSKIKFQKALLNWFMVKKRDLPWRRTSNPYKILVSEIMLQQTQVETVIPYYNRWIREFNNVKKLAGASIDKVLTLWEGMGYYSRARNLLHTAREIVKNHSGKVPQNYEALIQLPGIGEYTAGAVASIAYKKCVPAVDANVQRVLSRLYCLAPSALKNKKYRDLALNLMENAPASDFNQALMELGSLICLTGNPLCQICPVSFFCNAYSKGSQAQYSGKRISRKIEEIKVTLGVIVCNGTFFIQKRPSTGLFAGLWEFPGGKIEPDESPEEALIRELNEELGAKIKILHQEKAIRHNYTRFKVELHPFICKAQGRFSCKEGQTGALWISKEEIHSYAFPAANRKILRALMKNKFFLELLENGKKQKYKQLIKNKRKKHEIT